MNSVICEHAKLCQHEFGYYDWGCLRIVSKLK